MKCEKCGAEMVVKTNKINNQQFWACQGYPNCKNTKPLEAAAQPTQTSTQAPIVKQEASSNGIKAPTGEYQSLVYNKTLCANSYEVGSAGNRFKIYFETADDLRVKLAELKSAGLMEDPKVKFS